MDVAPLDWRPDTVFVQAGTSTRDAVVAGLGLRWSQPPRPGDFSGAVEVSLGQWSTRLTPQVPANSALGDRAHVLQLVVIPLARWQPRQGAAWFFEGGVGLSLHDRHYRVERVRQATRLNFQEEMAVGRVLGGGQAVSLRLAHMSNASLRKPNPGETWWSLRWELAW